MPEACDDPGLSARGVFETELRSLIARSLREAGREPGGVAVAGNWAQY